MRRSTKTMPVRIAWIIPAVLLSGLLLGAPRAAQAQSWNGSVSDLWGDANNWTPNTVPNSATATATITNATNNPVLIDINPTIANLTIGAADSASLNNNQSLTIAGGAGAGALAIAGTLTISSGGNLTDLILGGTGGSTITLSGGGTLALSNNFNNRVYSATGDTLVNSAGNTIEGAGQFGINNAGFGFALTNNGLINANLSGSTLQVAPAAALTNTGTIEATNGGTLNLIASVDNTGGLIKATGVGSVVELAGSAITNGTITTLTNGIVQNSGTASLSGVTISGGSTFTAVNNSSTTLAGTITNNGTIAQNSGGNLTDLRLNGAVTLTGGGTLAMSNNPNNRIYGINGGTDSLLNDTNHTIQGNGQVGINNGGFGFTLTNKGTIDANLSGSTLLVAPSGNVNNTGTLEATNGATLALTGGSFNNTGSGGITATGAGSIVELAGSTINGGTLTTASGGVIQNSGTATLNNVTVGAGSTFTAVNNSTTTLTGTETINGAIAQNSGGNFTDLKLSGAVTLTGTGSLTMSGNPNNRVYGITGSDSLLNSAGSTIQGAGQVGINNGGFGFTLTNSGLINANQTGGTLQVAPSNAVANTGTLEATNGGILTLTGGSFNNAGGLIRATGAGSVVDFSSSTINGGTLTTAAGGTIQNGGTATLNGVSVSSGSTVSLLNNTLTFLMGSISLAPTATLAQNSGGNFTDVRLNGAVTLTGGGTLAMSGNFNNRIFANNGGTDSLLNDTNNTIQGAGQVGINTGGFGFTLTNKGIIDANLGGTLQVAPSNPVSNSGTLEATGGGTMVLTGGTFNNSASGLILANGAGSVVDFSGSTITGGTLTTQSGGVIQNGGTATLDGTTNAPTISAGSTVSLLNNSSTTLMGTLINNGTLAQNSGGNFTDVHISGAVNVNGTGSWTLSNNPANRVYSDGSGSLTNGTGHTIQGAGQFGINNGGFGFTFINNGTVLANDSNMLQVAPGLNITNNGTFQANSGSLLNVIGTLTNYDPGTNTLTGGTYNAFSGTIQLPASAIVNNAATILLDGASATIASSSTGTDIVRGVIQTNSGSFTIQNGAVVTTSSSGFSNAGTVNIGALSTLTVGGAHDYNQTAGTTSLLASSSTISLGSGQSAVLTGGVLQGFGTISGNLQNSGGTVIPGLSGVAGVLTVTGNYVDPPSSHLFIQIGGPDPLHGLAQLDVGGSASLGGTLDLSLINGFTPSNGEDFVILTSSGLSGTFANVTGLHEGNVTFSVEYSPAGFANDVVVKASVASPTPEPSSLVLCGIGLAAIGGYLVRRSRKVAQS